MINAKGAQVAHPANESGRDILIHGWLPIVVALLALAISVRADLSATKFHGHWTQRAGSIITVLGAYVAYRDAKQSVKFIEQDLYMNFKLPYRFISVAMVVGGTVIWGYADLLL